MKRCACLHGHFYQPPRENPWTGAVERQMSAGRDHDWNVRVARECYVPNGEARVLDADGRISDLVDNYEWISFNFGPTLLSWLETAHPHAYQRLIEADRLSAKRLDGHGNAIAQSYHHSILPLANPRDRLTEIRWGLSDFERRFKRKAEGLWLPECAVDDATLEDLVGEGVRFVVLEPHQADKVRPLGSEQWMPADRALKTGLPYLWRAASGGSLAIFFYDGPLSRAVAFEGAMSDSRNFAARLANAVPPTAEDGLALVATDGESYGHHATFAEMGLAHLLRYALPEKGLTPVNLGWYLANHPPQQEVRLKSGGTSWSCAHGIERWRSDCGCGAEGDRQLKWRAPLRAAIDSLRWRLEQLYVASSRDLLIDPWAARDAYLAVVTDRSAESVDRFIQTYAPAAVTAESRVRVLILLELQRHALMMYTSCGWFFGEISRLEPVQILLYAARALELARSLGSEFEPEFVEALKRAPSNDAELADGAGVWENLVKPKIQTADHVAAHLAVSLLFDENVPHLIQGRRVESGDIIRRDEEGVTIVAGNAWFEELTTHERWSRSYFAAIMPGQKVQAYISAGEIKQGDFVRLSQEAAQSRLTCPLPQGRLFLLRDLRPDEREKVLNLVLQRRLERWESRAFDYLEELLPLVEQFRGLGLPLPAGLGEETRLVLAHVLAHIAGEFAQGVPASLSGFRALLARGRSAGIEPLPAVVEGPWERGMTRLINELSVNFNDKTLHEFRDAIEISQSAGLNDWRPMVQTRFFRLWKAGMTGSSDLARDCARLMGLAVLVPMNR